MRRPDKPEQPSDIKATHKDLGPQQTDLNRLVELLQQAMRAERASFAAQNRLRSQLAPMRPRIIER